MNTYLPDKLETRNRADAENAIIGIFLDEQNNLKESLSRAISQVTDRSSLVKYVGESTNSRLGNIYTQLSDHATIAAMSGIKTDIFD